MHCHRCGKNIETAGRISRNDLCPGCGVPLHACLNCRFYSEPAHHQCRESEAEFVSDKESANTCDYFEPGLNGVSGEKLKSDAARRQAEARAKLEKLFKK
ncbi:hypothetical protein JW777_02465 [bacterium]|nr:hypothetical protein [bacterium]